jgi:hypothetical protein
MLDAFDPKVHKGGRGAQIPLPNNLDKLRQWEIGFEAGIEQRVIYTQRDDGSPVVHFHPATRSGYTKEWLDGRAVGVEVRNRLGSEEVVRAIIMQQRRMLLAEAREKLRNTPQFSSSSSKAVRHGEKMPPPRYGGERMRGRDVAKLFAETGSPAHTTKTPGGRGYYSLWIGQDGDRIYSYRQELARKEQGSHSGHPDPGTVYMDPRTFSKTTTKFQTWIGVELRRAGWRVVFRNLDERVTE